MKLRLLAVLAALGLPLAFAGGYWLGQSPLAPIALYGPATDTPQPAREAFAPFWEVWELAHRSYYQQPLDEGILAQGAIDGMLAALDDPYTRYLPPEAEAAARQSMEGEVEGIGAEVTEEDGFVVIVSPFEGSPAERAGLAPGDILLAADGVELTGLGVAEAAEIVRGPAGTPVTLLVEREGEQFEVTVVRDIIRIPSVRGEMLDEGIAYLRLSRFANNTTDELTALLEELFAQEPRGLILDLRRNPGGGLDSAVNVADEFLPAGPILIERFGDGRERLFEATDDGLAEEIPLVVLVDEGSASASEVLAGALRDRDRAVIIGVTSFGKGTVQTWASLSNGGGVRITVARWLTPEGAWVHDQGLTPDYVIHAPDEPVEEIAQDPQVRAAIDYLAGRPITSQPEAEE
jgi:carboxyl-terminal processing protease